MNTPITKNRPIVTVIKNYEDKKSGKVSEARNEIKRRFFGLDWKDQKKILMAFLDACASDREWAYSRLLDLWDDCFESKLLTLWETYHEEKCAWVMIRHFPKEFLKDHINMFNHGRDYYFICRRFFDDADFVIDRERLSDTDYLIVLSHAGKHIDDETATDLLCRIVSDIAYHRCPSLELSRDYMLKGREMRAVSDFVSVSIALYYLDKMGNNDVVTAFSAWEECVQQSVLRSEEYRELFSKSLSDYDYKEKLVLIFQKHLRDALPSRYKKKITSK